MCEKKGEIILSDTSQKNKTWPSGLTHAIVTNRIFKSIINRSHGYNMDLSKICKSQTPIDSFGIKKGFVHSITIRI